MHLGYVLKKFPRASETFVLNEILAQQRQGADVTVFSLNKPEGYILAIVEFMQDGQHHVHYVRQPFKREPDFEVTSVNYDFEKLIGKGTIPS